MSIDAIESKYDGLFSEKLRSMYQLKDDIMLVEELTYEIKSSGGIILVDKQGSVDPYYISSEKPTFYYVLDSRRSKTEVRKGSIVLLPKFSIGYFSTFPFLNKYKADSIGKALVDDSQMVFRDLDTFKCFLKEISGEA